MFYNTFVESAGNSIVLNWINGKNDKEQLTIHEKGYKIAIIFVDLERKCIANEKGREYRMNVLRDGQNPLYESKNHDIKLSKYNVLIKSEDNQIFFNTLSGAIILANKGELDTIFQNDLFKEILYKNGFLVPKECDEVSYVENFITNCSLYPKSNMVVIAPTTHCNMECPYCFENDYIDKKHMTLEVAENVVKYIENNYCYEDLTVVWYGGEPLLELEIIDYISTSLIQVCHRKGISYSAGMITNGYLLTESLIEKLANKYKVKLLQVSLDGKGEVNDSRRKLRNGKESYQKILSNIFLAQERMKVSLRINVDYKNIYSTKELLTEILKNSNISHEQLIPYVAPITKVHDDLKYTTAIDREDFAQIFLDEYLDIFLHAERINKGVLNCKDYFFDQCCALERKAWRGLFPFSMTTPCGVLSSSQVTISADGKLYKCWDTIGVDDFCIGSIFDEKLEEEALEKWHNYKLPEKCLLCEYLPICLGGCIRESIVNKTPSCPYDFNIYKEILKRLCKV